MTHLVSKNTITPTKSNSNKDNISVRSKNKPRVGRKKAAWPREKARERITLPKSAQLISSRDVVRKQLARRRR